MKYRNVLLGLALLAVSDAAVAAPTLDEFLKRAALEDLTISPSGDHIAARVPLDDRTAMVILRRSDMAVTASLDPGQDGYVDAGYWVSDDRLFASISMKFGQTAQPYRLGLLRALRADGKSGKNFYGNMIDPLIDDPDHVLTYDCRKVVRGECWTKAYKVESDSEGGRREELVDAPIADADFMADRGGTIRFSWAWDNNDRQRTYLLRDGQWQLVNDEDTSGVEVVPIGTSYDLRYGFLRSERKDAPDVIERIDLATAERSVVASDAHSDPQSLVWSFDGHEPIGAVYGGNKPEIRFFDDKHPHAALTRELAASFPGELARVTSATRDGRTAVVTVLSDREPERYYLLDTASGDLTLLAQSRPWLKAKDMRPTEPVRFTARDGLTIEGWLTRPAASGPYPLVVVPHGGPFDVGDSWYYDDEVQMLAVRGYGVLRVNFRGSSGRGRPFMEAGYRQWGAAMQDDLTDATRWAIAQANVDPARVCIWGASYGGYAALMGAVREPDLYRCVIGVSGPYHLPTMYDWGSIQSTRYGESYLKRALGEDKAELLKHSPTQYAANIRAQLLLVHGMRDRRVSPEHLRAMRRSLDASGKPYKVYEPYTEGHGFFDQENRKKYYSMVLDFLDANLAPGKTAAAGNGAQEASATR